MTLSAPAHKGGPMARCKGKDQRRQGKGARNKPTREMLLVPLLLLQPPLQPRP